MINRNGTCSKNFKGVKPSNKKKSIEKLKNRLGDVGCIPIDITR
jgi:hypothetical protein